MSVVNWTEHEAITFMLSDKPKRNGVRRVSCLNAVLGDARGATGRDSAGTARSEQIELAGCWLGATGYLIMLDMIGEVFRPTQAQELSDTSIGKSLRYFAPSISRVDREALYALRCALMHDFSLVNQGRGRSPLRELRTHHFYLNASEAPIFKIQYPEIPWNGEISTITARNATRVNLRSLGDLAESIVRTLIELHENNNLSIALPGGVAEVQNRYCMTVYPDA